MDDTLFPVLKRQHEAVALGYVAARILESTIIVVGIVTLVSVVTPPQGPRASRRGRCRLPRHRRQVADRDP
jgi:hypothetical protein